MRARVTASGVRGVEVITGAGAGLDSARAGCCGAGVELGAAAGEGTGGGTAATFFLAQAALHSEIAATANGSMNLRASFIVSTCLLLPFLPVVTSIPIPEKQYFFPIRMEKQNRQSWRLFY